MWIQLDLFPELPSPKIVLRVQQKERGYFSITNAHLAELYLWYLGSQPIDVAMTRSEAARMIASPNYGQFWGSTRIVLLESDTSLSRSLAALIQDLGVKVYANPVMRESGLASQAHEYSSPRLAAKSLRREAMKPRRSKGR